jgi:lactoylglutathione lyase
MCSSGRAAATLPPEITGYRGFCTSASSADAVDELSRVLAAAGHQVLEPPHRANELGRYESVVLDPDGNRLKLSV